MLYCNVLVERMSFLQGNLFWEETTMEIKAGTAVKPSELELARQLEYIRMIREKNHAFEQANGRKKKFYSLAMGCQMNTTGMIL